MISEAGTKIMGTEGSPLMGHPTQGSSAVMGPDGRILSAAETPNEQLIIADLDMEQVVKAKTFADASGHCRPSCCLRARTKLTKSQTADPICYGWVPIRHRSPWYESLLRTKHEISPEWVGMIPGSGNACRKTL